MLHLCFRYKISIILIYQKHYLEKIWWSFQRYFLRNVRKRIQNLIWGQQNLVWAQTDRWYGSLYGESRRRIRLGLQKLRWWCLIWYLSIRIRKFRFDVLRLSCSRWHCWGWSRPWYRHQTLQRTLKSYNNNLFINFFISTFLIIKIICILLLS